MKWLQDPNDPLVLLFSARLRSQRRWLLAAGLLPAILALTIVGSASQAAGLSCCAALLTFFLFYQLSSTVVLGRGLVALGGQANLDEMLAANLPPSKLADRAAVFALLRGCLLSPLPLASMALSGSQLGALIILTLALLGQALATLNIYSSAYNNLFQSGQISNSELGQAGLRWMAQALLASAVLISVGCLVPGIRPFLVFVFIAATPILQGWEARRALIDWLEARRLGKRSEISPRANRRPDNFWLWGAERNAYLYRYHLSRLYWRGRPVWLMATTGLSSLFGILFLFGNPSSRAVLPAVALYVFAVTLLISIFRQVRDLQNEAQSGNLDLASISLGPQALVEQLAEVCYRPRLWEMLCLSLPFYLAALLGETRATLSATPLLLFFMFFTQYQMRVWAYLNLVTLFWIRRYSRLDRLMTASILVQWLGAAFLGLSLTAVSAVAIASSTVFGIEPASPALAGIGLGAFLGWIATLTFWLRWVRGKAVRLACSF